MKELTFKQAFHYPFNRAKGLLNIFWVFLPIIGWFALGGYGIRLVQEWIKGKFKELPQFSFKSDLKLGFFMFLKALPFMLAYGVFVFLISIFNPIVGGLVRFIIEITMIPILVINFMNKMTVQSFFEFGIITYVFNNFKDYFLTILKSIALGLLFLVMWLVLVGIPAGLFTQYIFLADFYRRKVK